jgi:hypothetical protein
MRAEHLPDFRISRCFIFTHVSIDYSESSRWRKPDPNRYRGNHFKLPLPVYYPNGTALLFQHYNSFRPPEGHSFIAGYLSVRQKMISLDSTDF